MNSKIHLSTLSMRDLYSSIHHVRAVAHGALSEEERRCARAELIELDAELWRRLTPTDDDIPDRRT